MPKYLVELTDGRKFEVEADQPPTENDLMSYMGESQAPAAPKQDEGYLSQLGSALSLGGRQMASGVKATFNAATGDVPDTAEAMAQMGALQQEQQANMSSEDLALNQAFEQNKSEYDAAKGLFPTVGALGGYVGSIVSHPGAAFKQAVQSAPNAAISAGTGLAGYALGGLLGAGAGIETGPGAILTGIAGAAAGGAVSNTLMESGPAIYDILNERTNGAASTMTAEQISQFLRQNPDIMSEGLKTGAIRGSVIGVIEGLGMKGAGRIMSVPERAAARAAQKQLIGAGVDVASKEAVDKALLDPALKSAVASAAKTAKDQFTTPGNLARLGGASALEVGSSGAGELAAQTAAGQETDMTAAVQEMMGEVALSAPTAAVSKGIEARKYFVPQVQEAISTAEASVQEAAAAGVPVSTTAQALEETKNLIIPDLSELQDTEATAEPFFQPDLVSGLAKLPNEQPIATAPVGGLIPETPSATVGNLEAGSGDSAILGIGDDGRTVLEEARVEAPRQAPQEEMAGAPALIPDEDAALATQAPSITELARQAAAIASGTEKGADLGFEKATPKRVRIAGEEYNVVAANPDGTLKLSNDQGDEFDTNPNEQWSEVTETPKDRLDYTADEVRSMSRAEFIKKEIDRAVFKKKLALQNAEAAIRNKFKPKKKIPVGISKLAVLQTKPRLTTEEKQLLADYNAAQRMRGASDIGELSRVKGEVWDSLQKSKPLTPPAEKTQKPSQTITGSNAQTGAEMPVQSKAGEAQITPTTEKPTNASFEDLAKEVENFNPTKGAARKDPATPDKIKDVADRVIASGQMDYIDNIGYFFSDIGGDIPAKTRDPVILRLRSVLLEQAQRLKNHAKGKQPISSQEKPTSIATEGQPMSGDSGSVVMDKTKPEQMTPEEFDGNELASAKYVEEMGKLDAKGANPPPREFMLKAATTVAHKDAITQASASKKPVSAAAVDAYGIKLPEGYVKDGELYVYRPEAKAEKPVSEMSRDEFNRGMAKKVKEATVKEGVMPKDEEKFPEKQAPSEKVEAGNTALDEMLSELAPAIQAKWTPEVRAKADKYFESGNYSDLDGLTSVQKTKINAARLKSNKEAEAAQKAADNLYEKKLREEEKENARLEKERAEQEKLTESRRESLDSIIGTPQGVEMNAVSAADGQESLALVHNSGDVPGVLNAFVGTSKEFLANPQNEKDFPELFAILKNGRVDEGNFAYGRAFVFTDGIGVNASDRANAKKLGISPAVAAVRRVLIHEGLVHRGIYGLPARLQMQILQWVKQNAKPEDLDALAKTYPQYADWATNPQQMLGLAEEFLAKNVEKMTRFPTSGPLARLVEILKDIWRYVTGKDGEPTVQNIRDIVKLLKAGAKAADARLVNGGGIKMSYIGEQAINNLPEERRQFMRDSLEAAKAMAANGKTSEEIRTVTGWFPGKYDGKMRWEVPDEDVVLSESQELTDIRNQLNDAKIDFESIKGKGLGFTPEFNAAQLKVGNLQNKLRRKEDGGDLSIIGDRLNHPELFAAYPAAKNIRLVLEPMQPNYGGYFDPISNKIAINSSHPKSAQLSSLLHEIQHWIQKQENFAEGGDLSQFLYSEDFKLSPEDQATVDSIDSKIASLREEERSLGEFFRNLPDSMKGVGKTQKESNRLNSISYEIRDLNDRRYAITKPARNKMAMDKYRKAAGEIESRDVQARQNFTSEQRKAIAPYSSENIAKEDAIVMFGGGIKMSQLRSQGFVTPEMDAEYMAAVESGDVEKQQAIVDAAAEIYESSKAPKTIVVDSVEKPLSQQTVIAFIRWERSDKRSHVNPVVSRQDQGKSGGARASLNRALSKDGLSFRDVAPRLINLQSSDRRLVRRDDSGQVIPLSQRFNPAKADIRESRIESTPTTAELNAQVRVAIDSDNEAAAKALVPTDVTVIRSLETQDLDDDGLPTEYFILSNGAPDSVMARIGGSYDSYRLTESQDEYSDRSIRNWLFDGLFEGMVPKKDFSDVKIHRIDVESRGGDFVLPTEIKASRISYTNPLDAQLASASERMRQMREKQGTQEVDRQSIRNEIRKAYDVAIQGQGSVQAPLQQVYDLAKAAIPTLTEKQFGEQVQVLYEDGSAFLVPTDRSADMLAAGEKWGVYDVAGLPASYIGVMPTEIKASVAVGGRKKADISPEVREQVKLIGSNEELALNRHHALKALREAQPKFHIKQDDEPIVAVAINIVDALKASGVKPQELNNYLTDPEFLDDLGITIDSSLYQALAMEIYNQQQEEVTRLEKAGNMGAANKLRRYVSAMQKKWYESGTKAGQRLNIRLQLINNPRYQGLFLATHLNEAMRENAQAKAEAQTEIKADDIEGADKKATDAASEKVADELEESQMDEILRLGEEQLDEREKSSLARIKGYVTRLGVIAKAWLLRKSKETRASNAAEASELLRKFVSMSDAELKADEAATHEALKKELGSFFGTGDTPKKKKVKGIIIDIVNQPNKPTKPRQPKAETPEQKAKREQAKKAKADATAGRIIYRTEELFRQGFKNDIRSGQDKPSIYKEFIQQIKEPTDLASFAARLAKLKVSQDVAERMFRTAALEKTDREAVANERNRIRNQELREKQAMNLVYLTEQNMRQSGMKGIQDRSASENDSVRKAFKDQINAGTEDAALKQPLSKEAFLKRLADLKVGAPVAEMLYKTAERERADLEASAKYDLLESPWALREMMRKLSELRFAENTPFTKPIPWKKLLSMSKGTQEQRRSEMEAAIRDDETLKNLDVADQKKLADLIENAWEAQRQKVFKTEIDRLTRLKKTSPKAKEALEGATQKLLEMINLGVLDNDELYSLIAEKFGFVPLTSEQKSEIEDIAQKLQGDLPPYRRTQLVSKFKEIITKTADVPFAQKAADWWVTAVLTGPRTAFTIGLGFLSGGYQVISNAVSLVAMNSGDINAWKSAGAAINDWVASMPRNAGNALGYLWDGREDRLDPTMSNISSWLNLDKKSLTQTDTAAVLLQSKNPISRLAGGFMTFFKRLLVALDMFNAASAKDGSLALSYYQTRQSQDAPFSLAELSSLRDFKAARNQVLAMEFGNKEPTSLAEKTLLDAWATQYLWQQIAKFEGIVENATYNAQQGAMSLDPSGIGGQLYHAILSTQSRQKELSSKFLKSAQQSMLRADSFEARAVAKSKMALAYFYQFAAYNMLGAVGLKFARYAGNRLNQTISFVPGLGAFRLHETEGVPAEMHRSQIIANQGMGLLVTFVALTLMKEMSDEPDEEKRGWGWEGPWDALTPERKSQRMSAGKQAYTLTIGGKTFKYQNWPMGGVLAAVGSLMDMIQYSPDKWNEKTIPGKVSSAGLAALLSVSDSASLSQFSQMFGRSVQTRDPLDAATNTLAKTAASYAGGFIPRIFKDVDAMFSPEINRYKTPFEFMAREVPIYRSSVGTPMLDIFAAPVAPSRSPTSREFIEQPTEPEYRQIGRLNERGIWLTSANPENRLVGKGSKKRHMTDEEGLRYIKATGKAYRDFVLRYTDRIIAMPKERARQFVLDKADEIRDKAAKQAVRKPIAQ